MNLNRKNPTEFQVLRIDDLESVWQSNFNPELPIKIYGPGWGSDGSDAYGIRNGYFH